MTAVDVARPECPGTTAFEVTEPLVQREPEMR